MYQIFDRLYLSTENGLFITAENKWEGLFSNRVERLVRDIIKPDAFFCISNKPFILFFENPTEKKDKLKEIWNFNESPVAIVAEHNSVEIYNGFNYLADEESLQLFGTEERLNDFSYFELVTGKSWEQYQADFSYDKRIDYHLLKNIESTRNILVEELTSKNLSRDLANSLLGKVIFVRYLIDRKFRLDFEQQGNSRSWTNAEFCEVLANKDEIRKFFIYLKAKFNGDLFPIETSELEAIPDECFSVIIRLLSGDEIATGQVSLFDLYNFSIIPVEFISNVYELFIGQNKQRKEGAYYTPLFLVDYILSETVEKKFQEQESTYSCKVLDPACGSGIFLVETLRKIIEQYQKNNPEYDAQPNRYKNTLKKLVLENIFGVDKDRSAIDVAIFSIYLTLLDYQNPSDIESFKFPELLNKNFFAADFFDTEAPFNKLFKELNFDFIIGNPPWKRGKGEEKNPLFVDYISKRKKAEKGTRKFPTEISNSEIAQAFVLRVSDFSSQQTKIGLIATSKILYNLKGRAFRKYLLDQFIITKVFELAPVRKEVFDKSNSKAVGPAVVLFYQFAHQKNTDSNTIEHIALKPSRFFSLFKVFTIHRGDYKKVVQSQLKKYDYLWKVLVYGSYLDFNLIKRLKESYSTIADTLDVENFHIGRGITIATQDRNHDVSDLVGKPFLTKSDIEVFWVNPTPKNKWTEALVHRARNKELFKAPMLLMKVGINSQFRLASAVSEKDAVFRHSFTAIKAKNSKLIDKLRIISGLLNSSTFSYFCLQTFSSLGIEREQSHDQEKFSVPFTNDSSISSTVSEISSLKQEQHALVLSDNRIANKIKVKLEELDNTILSAFSFSEQEKSLLNYATEVTIPMLMKHKGYERLYEPLPIEDKVLIEYINLFLARFNSIYKKLDQKLIVQVKHTNQIVGVFFELVSLYQEEDSINWVSASDQDMLKLLSSLGIEKVTDRLFIQKDVRGFEENGFYIIKPNERRLWHKATAYLDVNEFADAMLTAGKESTVDVQ